MSTAKGKSKAFFKCTQLAVIDRGSVESIGGSCFEGDTGIMEVVLPESLKEVGNNVFQNCTGIRKVTINSSELENLKNAF